MAHNTRLGATPKSNPEECHGHRGILEDARGILLRPTDTTIKGSMRGQTPLSLHPPVSGSRWCIVPIGVTQWNGRKPIQIFYGRTAIWKEAGELKEFPAGLGHPPYPQCHSPSLAMMARILLLRARTPRFLRSCPTL